VETEALLEYGDAGDGLAIQHNHMSIYIISSVSMLLDGQGLDMVAQIYAGAYASETSLY
jgi:hypothetical protein